MTVALVETGWNLYIGLTITIIILALFAIVLLNVLVDAIRWIKGGR